MLGHHPGTVPITKGWFSLSGIDGKGSAVAGFLIAVFVYGGWDGTLYVNEEVKHRRTNPGRAAIIAVGLLAVIYTVSQVGFQGVVSPAKLQAASENGTALVSVAQALGGGVLGQGDGPVHRAVGDRDDRAPASCSAPGSSTAWPATGRCRSSWPTCPAAGPPRSPPASSWGC